MKIAYKDKRFSAATLVIIDQAGEIIQEYANAGLTLTLRQLYYQFVARDLFANIQKNYSKLGRIISDGRMVGLIDWKAIEDRTRNIYRRSSWSNPGEIIQTCARTFKLDRWENQDNYVEIWIEKEALIGVISDVCYDLDVPYFACKGYVSKSEMWEASQRMEWRKETGKNTVIIHLGDHDPSGMDMSRDIRDQQLIFGGADKVHRIALNMDQIEMYNPPPNPTKMSDSRSFDYVNNFGDSCWELDALDPKMMQKLVGDTIKDYRDQDKYQATMEKETEYKNILNRVANNWETL